MPARPRSPRPRPTPSRRTRVAGMAPTVPRPSERVEDRPSDAADTTAASPAPAAPKGGGTATERLPLVSVEKPAKPAGKPRPKPAPAPARPSTAEPAERAEIGEVAEVEVEDAGDDPGPGRRARLAAGLRRRAVPLLAVAAVVLATVAVVAGIQDARLRGTPAATNTALVDVGATADVAAQLTDAIETVYSYDFARLDANENAARDVITPEFATQYGRLFGDVRARAPQQQAVVSGIVTSAAVKEITGDRAVMVVYLDQRVTRAAPDAQSQQVATAGRLTVTGQRVDGRWKIAAVAVL
jgi:Mce-associated membrane protein